MSKLEKLLNYISKHNDFYKNIIREYGITDPTDITQYPILTRQQLQENRYNMFSDGYKSKYFNQQLRRQSSSGSSGIPVNVYWDSKDWYASNIVLWRKRLQWYGIKPSDRYVMFTLSAFDTQNDGETVYYIEEPANILSVNVSMIQNNNGYEKLINIIGEFAPKWMYIQPFVLDKLIQAYKRVGKVPPKTLKYIESVGELLATDLRRRAKEFFGVPLANMYGSEEMNGIALECPNHCMHILHDNVYVEVQNETGIHLNGEGTSIITNLNNLGMPLVRYDQGDSIIISNDQKSYQMISMIKGRKMDSIKLNRGIELSSFMLLEVISEVNNQVNDAIIEYRFIFLRKSETLQCYIYLNENKGSDWYNNIALRITEAFSKKMFSRNLINIKVYKMNDRQSLTRKRKVLEIEE